MRFAGRFEPKGFPNDAFNNDVAYNGSFMNSGYVPSLRLSGGQRARRRRHPSAQRPQAEAAHEVDRRSGGSAQQLSHAGRRLDHVRRNDVHEPRPDLDRAGLPASASGRTTAAGASTTSMDRPILDFYATLSARYTVKRAEHNGVKLEIYYNPRARVRAAVDAAGVEGRSRLLRRPTSRRICIGSIASSSSRGTRDSRRRSRTRFRTRRASASCIARKRATTRSTSPTSSPRTSSRTSGGRTRSSAATARVRRCSPKDSPNTRRSP